uniref:LacI family DNA-binding transcriptional regulator n=1 Tax=Oceanispirochaeta sp. TaxID=2035350 RepID=UPI00261662D5
YKKKVTLKDIALKASVSTTTVSVILNGRKDVQIGEEARQRVLDAAAELGYTFTIPSKAKEAPVLCFVHSDVMEMNIGTSFLVRVASQRRSLCEAAGLIVQESEFNPSRALSYYQAVIASRPRMIVSFDNKFTKLHGSQKNDIPLFSLQGDREQLDSSVKRSLYLVDDSLVGEQGALHLLDKGYRSCGLVFPEIKGRCETERSSSFIKIFEKGGGKVRHVMLPFKDHLLIEQWFREWAGLEFDSFYFFSDAMALPGLRGLQVQGRRIPDDVAVLGTDNLYWGRFTYPSLTTMDLHEDRFAGKIFTEIKSYLSGEPFYSGETVIPVDLICREST